MEIEDIVGIMTLVLGVKLSGSVVRHAFWIIVFLVGNQTNIILIGWSVEEMRKESFLLFHESEGLWEGGQRHLEKAERVFENNVSSIDG